MRLMRFPLMFLLLLLLHAHDNVVSFRLKSRLYAQLMLQESWREDMKEKTREAVKRSGGPSEITMDELTKALITCGSTRVPSQIESDTKKKIRSVCL